MARPACRGPSPRDVALLTLAAPLLAAGLGLGIATFGLGVALIRLASLASVPGCDVIGAVEPEPLPAR